MENKPLSIKNFKEKIKDSTSFKIRDQLLQYNLSSFLNSIKETDAVIEKKQKLINFTMMFEETLPKYPCWRNSKYSDIEEASEVLEYLITKEKYSILFENKLAREQDELLLRCYQNFDFIEPRHLDINASLAQMPLVSVAGKQLSRINDFTSPRDKLICISNCFRIINSKTQIEIIINAHQGNVIHGADDSLPLFVYVLLKAKVEKLFSNFYFIKNYRYKPRREYRDPVEFKYTFTSLKIALKFIMELKANKLHLMPDESFKDLVNKCKKVSKSTQTSVQGNEIELQQFLNLSYSGNVSVEHFLENPRDLERFIFDYWMLVNLNKCG